MNISHLKLAFVFPGQGSQSVGMLAELAQQFSIVKETFAQASDVLHYDLWQLTQQGPEEVLNQTEKTQPALLAGSVAIWHIWQAQALPQPILLAGHSLGEYSALVCAGALEFTDAVKLVAERGRLMQAAVPPGQGAMAAIVGLENTVVEELCQQAAQGEVVAPANFNAPEQTVIAGHTNAVQRAVELSKQAGAKLAKILPVSVPSHCILMQPAATELAKHLAKTPMQTPTIKIVHNVDVNSYTNPVSIQIALTKQLVEPVRWVESMQFFAVQGITLAIECGAGKVLTGLNKRITTAFETLSLHTPEQLQICKKKIL